MSKLVKRMNRIKINHKKATGIAAIAVSLCTISGAQATAGNVALQVMLSNGKAEVFKLEEKPAISFSPDEMLISTSSLSSSYPRTDVQTMMFLDNAATARPSLSYDSVSYSYENGVFTCAGHEIAVFNVNGERVETSRDSISISSLPSGVYIINVNGRSIKIMK